MANNIEQQWANIGLARDLAQMPTDTTTPVENSIYKNIEDKIAGLQSAATTKLQNLTNTTEPKVRNLEGYEDVTITGLLDADTVKLADGRTVRMSDPLVRYDATEIAHPGDESFLSKVKDVFGISNKSDVAEDQQRRHASMLLGKQPHEVSKQDLIDIGNMQQNQMLADLQRGQGQERNLVELVPGMAQSDLTKNLNIQAKLKTSAGTGADMYNRVTGSLVNPNTMQDVGSLHANDPRLNTFSKEARNYGFKIDEDGNRVDTLDMGKSSLGNAAAGFGYTLGEGIVNTLDLIPEVVEYTYGNMVGDKAWKDTKGLYDTKESEAFKKWMGYSDTVLNNLGQQGVAAVKDAWENGDYWGLAKTAVDAVTTPELTAVSLGYVLGMVLPGGAAKKAVDVVSKVDKAADALVLADKTGKLTKAEALTKAQSEAGVGYKIASTLAGNVGFVSEAEQFGRDAEALYKETYNEEMPTEQKMLARAGGLLYAKMDAAVAKAIVLGKDPMAKLVPEAVKTLPDAMKANLAGKVAVLSGATAARVAGVFGLEAGTEMIQTSMEKIAGMYKEGERGVLDILDEQKYEIGSTGLLGGVGGIQMGAPSIALDTVGGTEGLLNVGNAIKDRFGSKEEAPVPTPDEEDTLVKPAGRFTDKSTEDLRADLATKVRGFAMAAQNNTDILPEDLQYAREVKAEIQSRELAEGLRSKTLGSISDIEEYLTREDIAGQVESKPIKELIEQVILDNTSSEELTDIQVALKNLEGIENKEEWDRTVDDTVNFRLAMQNLEKGAQTSRAGVIHEGIAPREDRRGYTEYAQKALQGSEKDYNHISRFVGVQEDKIDKLTTLHQDLQDKVRSQIENVLEKVANHGITKADIIKAMAYKAEGEKSLINKEEKARLDPVAKNVFKALRAAMPSVEKPWNILNIDGEQKIQYSNEWYSFSKNKGEFHNKYFEVLPEIAAEEGITDINWNEHRRQSSVSKVISYISEEVADMERISKYIGQRIFGIKDDTIVEPETEKDIEPEEVEAKETTAVEESAQPKEEAKLVEEVQPKEVKNTVVEETKVEEKATKVTEKESETVKEASIEPKEVVEDKPKTYVEQQLEADVDSMSIEELKEFASKKISSKDANELAKIKSKQDDANHRLNQELRKLVKDSETELSSAVLEFDIAETDKKNFIAELKELEANNIKLTKKAKELDKINKRIEDAFARRKEMQSQLKMYKELVKRDEEKVVKAQAEYERVKAESKKELGDALTLGDLSSLPKRIISMIKKLEGIQESIKEALIKVIKNAKLALRNLAKNKARELELENELDNIDKELAKLLKEKAAKGKPKVEKLLSEMTTLKEGIDSAKRSMALADEVIRGTGYTRLILVNSLKGKNKSSVKESDKVKLKAMPLDLNKIVTVTKRSASSLAKAPIDSMSEVEEMVQKLKDNGIVPAKITDIELARYPYLMMLLNKDGEIDNNVAAAMTTAVTKYIDENKISLVKLTDRDLESFYGVEENDILGKAATEHLGIPIKYIANNISKELERLLGLKPVHGMEEAYEKVMLGLAQASIYSEMGKNGLLREERTEYGGNGAETITIKLREDKFEELGGVKSKNKLLTDEFKVEYEKNSFRTEKKDIKPEDVKILRNEFTKPSEKQAKAIVKYTNLEWYPNVDIINVLRDIEYDKLKELLGYQSINTTEWTKEKQESVKGKNLQIEADIENLYDLIGSMDEGKLDGGAVYFDWTIWKVGRNAIESSGFNPQSIKLHRYTGTYKAQNGTVKKGDISEDIFKLGFAQALKFKIDKEPVDKSKEYADELLNKEGLDALEEAVHSGKTKFKFKWKEDGKEYEKEYKFEELSHAVMALVEGRKYVEAGGKDFDTSMILESDGLTNGFAFKMLQYLVTKNDSFELDEHLIKWLEKAGVTIGAKETEAVVNKIKEGKIVDAYRTLGMEVPNKVTNEDGSEKYDTIENTAIDGIEQTVNTALNSKELFDAKDNAKIAAFMKQKEVLTKYGALMIDEQNKVYRSEPEIEYVKNTTNKFLATRDSLTDINGLITDAARELMKQPFMTYGYGAGFNSILNAVTSIIESELTSELVKLGNREVGGTDAYNKAWDFAEAIGFNYNRRSELTKEFTPNIKVGEKSNLHQEIRNYVTLTYGKRIEEVLNEEFKALSQVNKEIIQASTTMFHIWKIVYNKIAGVEEGQVPSKEKHEEALKKTWKIFPVVASPLGKDPLVDGVPLVASTRETGVQNAYGDARTKFNGSSVKVQSIRETYKQIGVGAVVNMNQMIDGGTMTEVMNKFDIAQVFDALLLGVNQADAVSFINEVFGKFALSDEWSHIGAISDRLSDIVMGKELEDILAEVNKGESVKNQLTKEKLFGEVEAKLREEEGNKKVSKIPTVEKIAENMAARNYQNKKLRSELGENDIGFEQYVLDGKHVYKHTGKESTKGGSDIINRIIGDLKTRYKTGAVPEALNSIAEDLKGCK